MIYVHNNPNNIQYNDFVYVFMRLWFLPTTQQISINDDAWLKVPALRTDLSGGRKHYILPHPNLDTVCLVKVSSTGHLLKMHTSKLNEELDPIVFANLQENSISVSHWEEQNQQGWPYDNMFNQAAIKQRYELKFGQSTYDKHISNVSYNQIATKHKPRPCNCGKKR